MPSMHSNAPQQPRGSSTGKSLRRNNQDRPNCTSNAVSNNNNNNNNNNNTHVLKNSTVSANDDDDDDDDDDDEVEPPRLDPLETDRCFDPPSVALPPLNRTNGTAATTASLILGDTSSSGLSSLPPSSSSNAGAQPHSSQVAEPNSLVALDERLGEDLDGNRPAKRRKLDDTNVAGKPANSILDSRPRRARHESPPWKRVEAEGPTRILENGRRKSGRINAPSSPPPMTKSRRPSRSAKPVSEPAKTTSKKAVPAPKSAGKPATKPTSKPAAKTVSKPKTQPTRSSLRRAIAAADAEATQNVSSRVKSPSPPLLAAAPPPRRAATRRSLRSQAPKTPDTQPENKIKLRIRVPVIPPCHPDTIPRPRHATSIGDYFGQYSHVPVERGGLYLPEDGPQFTDEMARKEAELMVRLEDEAEPGGLLSQTRCSVYAPEPQPEMPRQWAHQDYVVKTMTNLRRLMLQEHNRHRQTAKRLAEACREEWLRKQPKTTEQLEAEKTEFCMTNYKIVVKTLAGTWENVRTEVTRRRIEEWKFQEEKRVKAALNMAVNISEQKLQAHRAHFDSDGDGSETDIEEDDDLSGMSDESEDLVQSGDDRRSIDELDVASRENGDSLDENESNMSSSLDESDEAEDQTDAELSPEQLRAKYANLPPLALDGEGSNMDDTTDESVDMDDDLGSSDFDDGASRDDCHEQAYTKKGVDTQEDADGHGDDSGNDDNSGEGAEQEEQDEDEDDDDDASYGVSGSLLGFLPKVELDEMQHLVDAGEHSGLDADVAAAEETHTESVVIPDDVPQSKLAFECSAGQDSLSNVAQPQRHGHDEPSPSLTLQHDSKPSQSTDAPVSLDDALANSCEKNGRVNQDSLSCDDYGVSPPAAGEVQLASTNYASASHHSHSSPHPAARALDKQPVNQADSPLATGNTDPASVSAVHAGKPKTEIPFLLRGTLREYQHRGLDWLAGLYANKTNGILADEMGLGKTIQTIALLAHLACVHGVWGPHLVVVPTSVMLNWEMEFKKWCPGFKILSYYGSIDERKRKRQGWTNDDTWNVCITSYQLVLADHQALKRRRWHYLILDEAHNIKNFKSQRWQILLGFNTHSRLLLTGTPLQNNLTELWSLLFFLMPSENGVGGFADLQEFQDWFHRPEAQILESGRDQLDDEARALIQKLHKVLRPYLLRRLKADVEKQMPAKYEHVELCRLSKRQRELYDGFLAMAGTRETLASGNYLSIINCLMQLRKVCNHPDLFVDRSISTSFCLPRSQPANYSATHDRIRKSLAIDPTATVNLDALNLVFTQNEHLSTHIVSRVAELSNNSQLATMCRIQHARAHKATSEHNPSTVLSNIQHLECVGRWSRLDELKRISYLNSHRRQKRPMYGKCLTETLDLGLQNQPRKPRPKIPQQILAWFENESSTVSSMVLSTQQRADALNTTIQKFCCVTPAVIARDMIEVMLGRDGVQAFTEADIKLSAPVRYAPFIRPERPIDPWHESRMRLSIQFPDKRLLQYDCGKLQVLDRLLRKLAKGGHRALIFTQMSKVLDILELFLNIHGHKYLRLDGATKIEQRQILTERFNHDDRILCFILSTRSGGLGINLTGADTVIFYDQDWNPAMDKQCQDRCHRIGQTRDVHIYRLVSEHTIETNILRKASQKQMLDDVVIQEGEFTTDYFTSAKGEAVAQDDETANFAIVDEDRVHRLLGIKAANEAVDRLLGQTACPSGRLKPNQFKMNQALEQAEDHEDVQAARAAEKEIQADEVDFGDDKLSSSAGIVTREMSVVAGSDPIFAAASANSQEVARNLLTCVDKQFAAEAEAVEYSAYNSPIQTIDDMMLSYMTWELANAPLELPKDKSKRRRDRRRR